MNVSLEAYRNSQSKWWCPSCRSYRFPNEVEYKKIDGATDDEGNPEHYLICDKCSAPVRAPDINNSEEILIGFVNGIMWSDVRKLFNPGQIDAFHLLYSEWKRGYMSGEKKLAYEKILTLKVLESFTDFLERRNY